MTTAAIIRDAAGDGVSLELSPAGTIKARIATAYARSKGHLWSSLRSALSDYPELLAQVPATDGAVDALHGQGRGAQGPARSAAGGIHRGA